MGRFPHVLRHAEAARWSHAGIDNIGVIMANVRTELEIGAAPGTVWDVIGNPDGLSDWHPAIATSVVTDGVRNCTLEGGGDLVEPIIEHSDGGRYYVYEIAQGPFPMSAYRSKIAVEDASGSSRVVWEAHFEPDDAASTDEMVATFDAIYRAGLEVVRERCEG